MFLYGAYLDRWGKCCLSYISSQTIYLICKAIKSIKGFVINIMTNFQTILKIYVYLMGNCTNLPHKNAFFSKLIYLEKRVDKHVF